LSVSVIQDPPRRLPRSAIDILLTQSLGKNYFCPEDVHKIGSIIDYIEENEEELGELVDAQC